MARSLADRHAAEALGFARLVRAIHDDATRVRRPPSKGDARGVPCVGAGGADIRRDPQLVLEDRDKDALRYRDLLGE